MGKFLKKNWFMILIVALFAGISVYYIYDTNKGKLKGKTDNGEDVVYEINGQNETASQFYDDLYKNNSSSALTSMFEKAVADASIKTDKNIKEVVKKQADSIKSSYQSSYGSSYQTYLDNDIKATGYDSLEEFLTTREKIYQITAAYAKADFDNLQIRHISYILIKRDDSTNTSKDPTANEKSKMDAVDAMLKDSDFASTAQKYSEDSTTAANGGVLGVIDKNASSLDTSFLDAALALSEGETSDWVYSSNFGFFKIYCDASTPDTLDSLYSSDSSANPYEDLISTYDSSLTNKAIWAKAQDLGIDFKGNDDIETKIKTALNVSDDSDSSSN